MATSSLSPRRSSGRLFLALGLGLVVLGVLAYLVQLLLHRLWLPWYLPVAATLGTALLVVSLWRARTVWRVLALLLVLLITVACWRLVLAHHLPDYTGPVAAEEPFPAFTTARADGTPFSQRDLVGDRDNVLVFFRGRW